MVINRVTRREKFERYKCSVTFFSIGGVPVSSGKWNGRLPLPDVGDREDRGGPSEPTASKVPNGEAWASQAKRRVQ